jgi:nicotinamidase-related amidase
MITAEPAPVAIDMGRTALIIIDMQRDFLQPGGFGDAALGNDVSRLHAAVAPCADVLAAARKVGLLLSTRVKATGEPGHDIIPELYPVAGGPVIDKPGKGAFYQTDLELMLKNRSIEKLLVCGVTTEVCVNTTVREANDRGFRCIVLSDCCASYFPEFHDMGLKMIKAQGGIFGSVSASAPVIEALSKS